MAPAELGATGSRQALPTWATQAPVATIIEAIANAVKRPGGRARLLHADNRSGAWVSVAEAVQSGQAFFVEVADDVLAIDCDSADRVDVVQKIAADLQVHGYRPVQIASGRPDHQHLFVRVADSQARASFVERAKQAGLDVRRSIRPPGSPHRLGLSVRFLDPADPAEALAALSRRARPPLSPGMEWMLRTGDFRGRYASRSEMLLGLAMAAVNAGWTFSEYVESILTSAAGEKLRGRTAQAAEKYLKRCWAKAVQRAVTTPPVRNRTDAQRKIISIFEAAFKEVMTWSGPAGATDAKVLIGHLDLAFEVGSPTYHVSVRTLANRTVIPATTVARSHRRLIKRGWLSLICGACGRDANVWRLHVGPPRTGRFTNGNQRHTPTSVGGRKESVPFVAETETDEPITSPLALNRPTETELKNLSAMPGNASTSTERVRRHRERRALRNATVSTTKDRGLQLSADVFIKLGRSTYMVWLTLSGEKSRTTKTVAGLREIKSRSALHHLHKLRDNGLATKDHRGWRRVGDLAQVAVELGVAGEGARQQMRNREQTQAWRAWLADHPEPPAKRVRDAIARDRNRGHEHERRRAR